MGSRGRRKQQEQMMMMRWWPHQHHHQQQQQSTLAPLMEGPDQMEMHLDSDLLLNNNNKKESSWEIVREWFRMQKNPSSTLMETSSSSGMEELIGQRQDLKLLLGVLGCPLAPIPLSHSSTITKNNICSASPLFLHPLPHVKDIPFETSRAHYIIQQYMAATGCSKMKKSRKNMYATGAMRMICCETEISSGKGPVKRIGGSNNRSGESGCFVLWQMKPGMWSLELVLGVHKLVAGSDGNIVWRHTPWLGTHAAKGPQRPLRRIIQGLDPKSTARLFTRAQCMGEERIGDEECFVLKVAADRAAVMERNEGGPAEVIRHVLCGYFSQKSGLLIYLEDSHLTRVQPQSSPNDEEDYDDTVYWETTIGSSIEDYRDVDGLMIAHRGRTVATVFRFSENSMEHTRTRMEELWSIDDVVFDVPGLSFDSFIPPTDIFDLP